MPSCFQKTFFCVSAGLSFASFILILVAMGTQKWMTGKILCKTGAELVNATDPELVKFMGEIYYGLFGGRKMRQCGLGGRPSKFKMFPHLVKKVNTTLHVTIILFLSVAFSFALVSCGLCILNLLKVPFRAIQGPAGIALWNLLAGGCTTLAVIAFVAAVKLHRLTERIANFRENGFQFLILEEEYMPSFWLCVASATIHGLNLVIVALSTVRFLTPKMKTEEANVTAEDIMY
ncbi:clarin-2 [Python bivittatus]|uniref:Clarin-2 n=1 Tax=Python bivittatus TaxID=176946 RepID=A0A9F2RBU0_PYTBI|nr:clarin-2 [Python bivittatus]